MIIVLQSYTYWEEPVTQIWTWYRCFKLYVCFFIWTIMTQKVILRVVFQFSISFKLLFFSIILSFNLIWNSLHSLKRPQTHNCSSISASFVLSLWVWEKKDSEILTALERGTPFIVSVDMCSNMRIKWSNLEGDPNKIAYNAKCTILITTSYYYYYFYY